MGCGELFAATSEALVEIINAIRGRLSPWGVARLDEGKNTDVVMITRVRRVSRVGRYLGRLEIPVASVGRGSPIAGSAWPYQSGRGTYT